MPISIPFKSPYILDDEINFREYYSGDLFPSVHKRVLGYTANQLIMGIQSQGYKERKVKFTIRPDELQVSCTCKSAKDALCAHGYYALSELCWNSKKIFTIFEPGNLVSIALENKNVFNINCSNPAHFIVPDKSLGHLYDFKKIATTEIEKIISLTPSAPVMRETEIVWLLVHTMIPWQNYLPILVPVKGKFNKAGTMVKSFGRGFANINNEALLNTPDRKELCRLSELMYSERGHDTEFGLEALVAGVTRVADNFYHWEQALPMLCQQRFVYKFRLGHARYFIRTKPVGNYLEQISISGDRPQLQFALKDKGNYYQFSLQYLVRDKPIKAPMDDALFFVCSGVQYYLLASLQDVAMVQWMRNYDNLISVMKRSFPVFEKEILNPIEKIYRIVRK